MSEIRGDPYKAAGVNTELGNDISKVMYEAAKATWTNREGRYGTMEELHNSFSGNRVMPMRYLGNVSELVDNLNSDGVGTKIEIAERLENHSTVAFDLFAMSSDDAAIRGAEPVKVNTVLDVKKLTDSETMWRAIKQLARGSIAAAAAADIVITNGEVAELGNRVGGYGEFNYNWSSTVHWVGHESRVLTGLEPRPGDKLIGIQEPGFRSNGISLVRQVFGEEFGPDWHKTIVPRFGKRLGEIALIPSIIYTKLLVDMSGGYDINRRANAPFSGAAHITGGGIPEKLGRMLEPTGLGAVIDKPLKPCYAMRLLQNITLQSNDPDVRVTDEIAYKKLNMGPGLIIATSSPDRTLEVIENHGLSGNVIGEIIDEPVIRIKSHGMEKPKQVINYPLAT